MYTKNRLHFQLNMLLVAFITGQFASVIFVFSSTNFILVIMIADYDHFVLQIIQQICVHAIRLLKLFFSLVCLFLFFLGISLNFISLTHSKTPFKNQLIDQDKFQLNAFCKTQFQ